MKDKKRTNQQNKALWKYFELLADTFNSMGLDMRRVLRPSIDIPWSKESICEFLWKPIMDFQLRKESTTELTSKEVDEIYDTLNRHIGEKFGVHVPFPSEEELISKSRLST